MGNGIHGVGNRGPGNDVPGTAPTRADPPRASPSSSGDGDLRLELPTTPRDRYGAAGNLPATLPITPLPVEQLVPDLSHLQNLAEVVSRFASDAALLGEQLAPPQGDPDANVGRVYEFFTRYAERYVLLATSPADSGLGASDQQGRGSAAAQTGVPLLNSELMKGLAEDPAPTDRAATTRKFLNVLEPLGFEHLVDPRSGQNALAAARSLLTVASFQDFERVVSQFEAPSVAPEVRPSDLSVLAKAGEASLSYGVAAHRVIVATSERSDLHDFRDPERPRRTGTSRRLGPRLFWNTLHTFRGVGEDSVQHQDQLNKVAVTAILLLGAALAVVAVLVWL